MKISEKLSQIYAATNGGLDIIIDACPQAAEKIRLNKNFCMRENDKTPSAHAYPPKDSSDCWHVKDFGMTEGGGYYTPIDIYLWSKGYTQKQFTLAIQELMEAYGVEETLTPGINKPLIEKRDATADEIGLPPRVKCRPGFSNDDIAVWGSFVKAECLKELGWEAVDSVTITVDGKTIVKRPTPTYPIFAQTCTYTDEQCNIHQFQKLYEPMNPNKAYRFSIVGKKPQHYIFGLQALRQKFEQHGGEKLDEVVMVSGGSDAVCCLSMGYQPVWLGSETENLTEADFWMLKKYTRRVVNIPDIDDTGRKAGIRLAMRLPELHTAWLTDRDMNQLHDNRGRRRKDLKDYLQLHPSQDAMRRLMDRALCAQFWTKSDDKQGTGRPKYTLSRANLNYFLWLNGFCTLRDDNRREPQYIHVEGCRVKRIHAKNIVNFVTRWMQDQGLDQKLQNLVLRSHDLPTNQLSTLPERDDLDFDRSTVDSQRFYFSNCWAEVTANDIERHPYSTLNDRYIWDDSIIPHDYRSMKPMFHVERDGEAYRVTVADRQPSKFFDIIRNTSRLHWRKADEGGLTLTDEELAEEQQCLASKLACIGYLLHGYKSESAAWAVICLDSKIGQKEDECNGGSGKSLFLRTVSRMLSMYYIDAHVQSIVDNRFIFDGVTADTDIVIVDECHRKLNFDFFFGKITGDLNVEEKGNHPVLIPFKDSPKFAFATNFVLKRHDPSTERRIWPQVFSDYYHVATKQNDYLESRSIRDDLGCNLMGSEYAEADWQADIAFMLQCLQFYLSLPTDERRILPPMGRIERREQRAAIGKDFEQWADEFLAPDSGNLDREFKSLDMLHNFNQETGYGWSIIKFTKRLKNYCEYMDHIECLNPMTVTGKKQDGASWVKRENNTFVRYYYVKSKS